jgi:hypothetical protein
MTTKAPPKEVAIKPKVTAAAAPVAVAAVHTTPATNTVQTALPAKVKTTSPVVGQAKY